MRAALLFCLLASAAGAETLMTPEDFEAWSTGKTLAYSEDGVVYGSEAYFPGRKVRDADAGGPCRDGSWHAEGDAICFVYPAYDGTHCWHYWREGGQVFARPLSPDATYPPQRVTEAAAPLACPAPDVGV